MYSTDGRWWPARPRVSPTLDPVRGRAHALVGAVAALPVSAHSGRAVLVGLAAGVVGGLLPDVDHPGSIAGRRLPWPAVREGSCQVGRWRPGGVIRHRGEVHSPEAAVIAATLAGVVATQAHGWLPAGATWVVTVGVLLGYLSHLLADLLSPTPQMLLWPLSRRRWRPRWLPAVEVDSTSGHALEAMVSVAALTLLVTVERSALASWPSLRVPPISRMIPPRRWG